jgi:metal-dependent amidase/aminoacylase/carboxypeptidase family protein
VVNDTESVALLRAAVTQGLGADALTETGQSLGGEDFGWYLGHVPGGMARLGVYSGTGPMCDLHRGTFDLDERAIAVGVRTLVHTAYATLR